MMIVNVFQEKEKERRSKSKNANPIYSWMVQPLEETGIKSGQFNLARSSQRLNFDRENLKRSSNSFSVDSGVSSLSSLTEHDINKKEEAGLTCSILSHGRVLRICIIQTILRTDSCRNGKLK